MSGLSPTLLLRQTTAQSIPHNTLTTMSWDSAVYNSGPSSWWSSGTPGDIVLPYQGAYFFAAQAVLSSNGGPYQMLQLQDVGGVQYKLNALAYGLSAPGDEASQYLDLSGVIKAPITTDLNTVRIRAYQNTGASLSTANLHGFPYKAWVSFTYLGGTDPVDIGVAANQAKLSAKAFSRSIG